MFAFKTKPLINQIDTVEKLLASQVAKIGMGCFSEQGTGKSKCVIDFVDALVDREGAKSKVLIVTQNAVVEAFADEFAKHSRHYPDAVAVRGDRKKRLKLLDEIDEAGHGVAVLNHFVVSALKYKPGTKTIAQTHLARRGYHVVVLDEASRIKNPFTKISLAHHDFARFGPPDQIRVPLTGTPITESPLDFWSVFRFLDPGIFGSYREYKYQYGDWQMETVYRGGKPVDHEVCTRYKNLEHLKRKAAKHYVRWLKKDCVDLPPKTFTKRIVSWDKAQKKILDEYIENKIVRVNNHPIASSNPGDTLSRIRQITQGFVYLDAHEVRYELVCKTPPKINALLDTIVDYRSTGPILVFADFNADVRIIEKALEAAGMSHREIMGETKSADRWQNVQDFQAGKVDVLVAKTSIIAYGLTLTTASTAIYYSNGFSSEIRLQSQDRIHRIGQNALSITYVDLCMENSVDLAILGSLKSKAKVAEDLLTHDQIVRLASGVAE